MGNTFSDKYSLLHMAVGIVVYYWNIPFTLWFVIHALFEYLENTRTGMKIINNFTFWPGGKDHADKLINRLGDHFYALLGWYFADIISKW